jgi:hypothetical protein
MATATEAPASITAEGPTQHTQNQVSRLTAPQLRLLHRPVDPKRIGKDDKGFAHMQAWDIKRYLLRVFGFAGYDTENRELALVREIETPNGNRSKWTVVYRAQVRLIVKDVQGRELAHWDGEAAGAGNNLPNLADAHDMGMKTASSQAFKRAATHLGDAFGLSLYNDGSPAPVVNFSAAHPPEQWEKVAAPLPEPDDAPVRPEPGSQPAEDVAATQQEAATPAPARAPAQEPGQESRDAALARLTEQYRNCWGNALALTQIRIEGKKLGLNATRVQGPPPESAWTTFDDLLVARIDELKAAQANATEGKAA